MWSDYRERERSHQACDEIAQELVFERDGRQHFPDSPVWTGISTSVVRRVSFRGELETDYERGIDVGDAGHRRAG